MLGNPRRAGVPRPAMEGGRHVQTEAVREVVREVHETREEHGREEPQRNSTGLPANIAQTTADAEFSSRGSGMDTTERGAAANLMSIRESPALGLSLMDMAAKPGLSASTVFICIMRGDACLLLASTMLPECVYVWFVVRSVYVRVGDGDFCGTIAVIPMNVACRWYY